MICPKCQAEIKEGYLYCQECGVEIIMVPDFDVEADASITPISDIAELIDEPPKDEQPVIEQIETIEEIVDNNKNNGKRKIGPWIAIVLVVLLGSVFVVGIYKIFNTVSNYYSFDYQYAKAEEEYNRKDYEATVKTAKHVISIDKEAEGPRLLLADSYFALEKYDESIAVLNDLLNDFPNDATIYKRLIANYEIEGDINALVSLSKQCEDESIAALFYGYASSEPEFSIEEGTYYELQSLRILAGGNGTIYYTLDGSEPNVTSDVYTTPIMLEEGTTKVSAIYVNEKGVVSDIVSKTYTIEIIVPSMPRLLTQPGDYTAPRMIKVEGTMDGKIYYTVDGTDPTDESNIYETPLVMPLGKSEYRFVLINNSNISSDVLIAEYNLNMEAIIDKTTAEASVKLFLMAKGDNVLGNEYIAKFGYAQGANSYYIIDEMDGSAGKMKRTGRVFAVDSATGALFSATKNDETGEYDFGMIL